MLLMIHSRSRGWGKALWTELRRAWSKTFIVMDATAHLDPDYTMPGAPSLLRLPIVQRFPNLVIHCTSIKDVSTRKFVEEWDTKYEKNLQNLLSSISSKFPGEEILIVTTKSMKSDVQEATKVYPQVRTNHFGNLKGSNEYRACKHIIFTNFLRWRLESYLLRALWLSDSGSSGVLNKALAPIMKGANSIMVARGKFSNGAEFRNSEVEMLRLQYDTPDIIQPL